MRLRIHGTCSDSSPEAPVTLLLKASRVRSQRLREATHLHENENWFRYR